MIFFENNDQIGDYGRVEIAMRYFVYSTQPKQQIPVCSVEEMMQLAIEERAWPEFVDPDSVPDWYEELVYGKSLKRLGVSRRRLKKFLGKIFLKYGEPTKVEKIAKDYNNYWRKLDEAVYFDFYTQEYPDFTYD